VQAPPPQGGGGGGVRGGSLTGEGAARLTVGVELFDFLLAAGKMLTLELELACYCHVFADELVYVGHLLLQHLLIALEEHVLMLGAKETLL